MLLTCSGENGYLRSHENRLLRDEAVIEDRRAHIVGSRDVDGVQVRQFLTGGRALIDRWDILICLEELVHGTGLQTCGLSPSATSLSCRSGRICTYIVARAVEAGGITGAHLLRSLE